MNYSINSIESKKKKLIIKLLIFTDFTGQTKRSTVREFDCCWIQSRFSFNVKHQEWRCIRRTSSRRGRNFERSLFVRSDYRQQIDSQNSLKQTIRSNFWPEFGLTGKPLCVSARSLYLFPVCQENSTALKQSGKRENCIKVSGVKFTLIVSTVFSIRFSSQTPFYLFLSSLLSPIEYRNYSLTELFRFIR